MRLMQKARESRRTGYLVLGAVLLTSLALAGCTQQREAAGPENSDSALSSATASLPGSAEPVEGMLKPSNLCIENNSSLPVTIVWKHAEGTDGDCGWGSGHDDVWTEDVVASIVVNGQETVLAAADNEAFQRPSVAIQDVTLNAPQCFFFRAYLDMGETYKFRLGEKFDDGIAAYELRRESLEGPYKEMRVIIHDSENPVDNVRLRRCA